MGRPLALTAVVLALVALTAVIAALSLSVQVSGTSMTPTIEPGDRLSIDVLHGDGGYRRFDVVEASVEAAGTPIVKRVIGLPGDRVRVIGGEHPRVLVRPRGASTWSEVANPTWDHQIGDATEACCTSSGTSQSTARAATVPDDAYWVLGDNWGGSSDSRVFGWIPKTSIRARLTRRTLPLSRFGRLTSAARLVDEPLRVRGAGH